MTVALKTRLSHEQIKPKIGSRVLNSKEELLSGVLADQLNDLLEQRGVLVFPEVHFTDEEQIAFTNSLGGNALEVRGEEVFKISLDRAINREAVEYLKGSLFWHIDGTMNKAPIRGSVLASKVLPTWGGNTEFANTYAAYDDLPEDTKRKIDDLRVIHSMGFRSFITRRSRRLRSSRTGSRAVTKSSCLWCGSTVRVASRWCWATRPNVSSASVRWRAQNPPWPARMGDQRTLPLCP